jgi:acetyl esterase
MGTIGPVRHRPRRVLGIALIVLLVLVGASVLAFENSPWPSVWVIRWVFARSGAAANTALSARVPSGVHAETGVRYAENDADALLDIYRPSSLDGHRLPVIVWIHGGGYVAGNRSEIANYARILASDGYAVAVVDYSLAPEVRYPVVVRQLNRALAFLSEDAERLQLDSHRFILGGDSAGAQLAAQMALLISSPTYAESMGLHPSIAREQLAGAVLFCGPYDGQLMAFQASSSWFTRTVLWSYFGSLSPSKESLDSFSIAPHVTSDFPAVFMTVGNGDPLAPQSIALANALQRKGVRVDALFYAPSHKPSLEHEYQFDLSLPESEEALRRTRAFLRGLVASKGG